MNARLPTPTVHSAVDCFVTTASGDTSLKLSNEMAFGIDTRGDLSFDVQRPGDFVRLAKTSAGIVVDVLSGSASIDGEPAASSQLVFAPQTRLEVAGHAFFIHLTMQAMPVDEGPVRVEQIAVQPRRWPWLLIGAAALFGGVAIALWQGDGLRADAPPMPAFVAPDIEPITLVAPTAPVAVRVDSQALTVDPPPRYKRILPAVTALAVAERGNAEPVVAETVPPLAERVEDLPHLVEIEPEPIETALKEVDPEHFLVAAQWALRKGDRDGAEVLLNEVLTREPEHRLAQSLLRQLEFIGAELAAAH